MEITAPRTQFDLTRFDTTTAARLRDTPRALERGSGFERVAIDRSAFAEDTSAANPILRVLQRLARGSVRRLGKHVVRESFHVAGYRNQVSSALLRRYDELRALGQRGALSAADEAEQASIRQVMGKMNRKSFFKSRAAAKEAIKDVSSQAIERGVGNVSPRSVLDAAEEGVEGATRYLQSAGMRDFTVREATERGVTAVSNDGRFAVRWSKRGGPGREAGYTVAMEADLGKQVGTIPEGIATGRYETPTSSARVVFTTAAEGNGAAAHFHTVFPVERIGAGLGVGAGLMFVNEAEAAEMEESFEAAAPGARDILRTTHDADVPNIDGGTDFVEGLTLTENLEVLEGKMVDYYGPAFREAAADPYGLRAGRRDPHYQAMTIINDVFAIGDMMSDGHLSDTEEVWAHVDRQLGRLPTEMQRVMDEAETDFGYQMRDLREEAQRQVGGGWNEEAWRLIETTAWESFRASLATDAAAPPQY